MDNDNVDKLFANGLTLPEVMPLVLTRMDGAIGQPLEMT